MPAELAVMKPTVSRCGAKPVTDAERLREQQEQTSDDGADRGLGSRADDDGGHTGGGDETADVGIPHPGQQGADPDDDRQKPP
jgi:hypothetical protein